MLIVSQFSFQIPVYSTIVESTFLPTTRCATFYETQYETEIVPEYVLQHFTETKYLDKFLTVTNYLTNYQTKFNTHVVTETEFKPSYITKTEYVTHIETKYRPQFITETEIAPITETKVIYKTEILPQTQYDKPIEQDTVQPVNLPDIPNNFEQGPDAAQLPLDAKNEFTEIEEFRETHLLEALKQYGLDYNYDAQSLGQTDSEIDGRKSIDMERRPENIVLDISKFEESGVRTGNLQTNPAVNMPSTTDMRFNDQGPIQGTSDYSDDGIDTQFDGMLGMVNGEHSRNNPNGMLGVVNGEQSRNNPNDRPTFDSFDVNDAKNPPVTQFPVNNNPGQPGIGAIGVHKRHTNPIFRRGRRTYKNLQK